MCIYIYIYIYIYISISIYIDIYKVEILSFAISAGQLDGQPTPIVDLGGMGSRPGVLLTRSAPANEPA